MRDGGFVDAGIICIREGAMDQKRNDELLRSDDQSSLEELRRFLFKESCRLKNQESALDDQWHKLEKERNALKEEIDEAGRKLQEQRAEFEHDRSFFDQKMQILKDGYDKLSNDRKSLEIEKKRIAQERMMLQEDIANADEKLKEQSAGLMNVLFKGADTPLSLKKRYKALMKIFHPDNMNGDDELVQWLNIEYSKLKQEMDEAMGEEASEN